MSEAAKLKTFGIIGLVAGGFLTITSLFVSKPYTNGINTRAEETSAYSGGNFYLWYRWGEGTVIDYSVFNCTNVFDVTFGNAKPEFTQYNQVQSYYPN